MTSKLTIFEVMLKFLVFLVIFACGANSISTMYYYFKNNTSDRVAFFYGKSANSGVVQVFKDAIRERSLEKLPNLYTGPYERMIQLEQYQLLKTLVDLYQLPIEEKKQLLVYIPRTNRTYWELLNYCPTDPYIAPALTGIAQLAGTPIAACETIYNGTESYITYAGPMEVSYGDEEICRLSRQKGMQKVVIIEMASPRLLQCAGALESK